MSWNLGSRMHGTVGRALGTAYAYAFNQRRGVSKTRIDRRAVVRARSRVDTPQCHAGRVRWVLPIQDRRGYGKPRKCRRYHDTPW